MLLFVTCLNPFSALSYQCITIAIFKGIGGASLDAGRFITFGNTVQTGGSAKGALVHFSKAGYQVALRAWHVEGTGFYAIAATSAGILVISNKAALIMIEGAVGTNLDTSSISAVHAGSTGKEPSYFPAGFNLPEFHLEPGGGG